jgi:hypothetical protein
MLSSVSVMVSPSLASLPPQHGRLIRRRVGGHFILGRGGLEFFELHLQLVEQFATALGRGAETVALHFGDQ